MSIPAAEIISIVSIVTNMALVLTGVKLVRHLSHLEFKVDMMWGVFVRKFGDRIEDPILHNHDNYNRE